MKNPNLLKNGSVDLYKKLARFWGIHEHFREQGPDIQVARTGVLFQFSNKVLVIDRAELAVGFKHTHNEVAVFFEYIDIPAEHFNSEYRGYTGCIDTGFFPVLDSEQSRIGHIGRVFHIIVHNKIF